MIRYLTLIFVFFACLSAKGQPPAEKITWLTFEQAVEASEINPKKIFIDVYTSWCGWCKKMDASTFVDDSITSYMSKNFYCVKLNAETKDTIRFREKVFIFKPEYKSNELALSLLSGKMSYPSFVFMDEKFALLTLVQSYLTVPQLMPMLHYFGENIHLTKSWEDYAKEAN